ncbi:hypothetical protein [Actinomycetospora termitidis]|uniref:Uncharacterized protein n=1 Tax=Actinomycetospora termitidis TaxID=3053470 RepID=A0ABT7MIB3_9PSEU|nr:hypothetical protein [Actinomycetospora sp. Odt1-22]MDL5160420.1 hypothetical protein [Actinomycetospora sp. Odt1-22]
MNPTYPAAHLTTGDRGADEVRSPGCSWHWEVYARVLAGLRAARGEPGPCDPATLAAAEAVMSELAPITDALARVPAPRTTISACPAGPR